MTDRLKDIPVLANDGSNIKQFADAVREALQTFRGYRGDALDKAITRRDGLDLGFLSRGPGLGGGGFVYAPGGANGVGGVYEPDLTPPPTPTGLVVTAGLSYLYIEHDTPAYPQGHGHDRTVVYGAKWPTSDPTAPVFSEAVELCEFQGIVGAYPTEPATRWAVWIKWKSIDGVLSTSPAGGANGAQATTGQDVAQLLEALTGEITDSQLYGDLATRVGSIPALQSQIDSLTSTPPYDNATTYAEDDLVSYAGKLYKALSTTTGNLPTSTTFWVKVGDYDSLAGVVGAHTASLADHDSRITSNAGAISAEVSQRTILAAQVNSRTGGVALNSDPFCRRADQWELGGFGVLPTFSNFAFGIAGTSAMVTGATEASADARYGVPTIVGRRYKVSALVNRDAGCNGLFYLRYVRKSATNVTLGQVTSPVDAVTPPAESWTRYSFEFIATADDSFVSPRVILNFTGTVGAMYAQDVRIEDTTEFATLTAAVQTEATARATTDNGLLAQYTVKLDVNGYVSGYGIASTSSGAAPTSSFIVRADSFAIAAPSGPGITPAVPFIVRTTAGVVNGVGYPAGVYIDSAYILDLTAAVARLGTAWIDDAKVGNLSAAKLTAGSGVIGGNLRSTNYVSGTSGWIVRPDGYAEFSNISIRGATMTGTIFAAAGTIGGITIGATDLRSTNYVPATTGWRIHSDGSTEFLNVYARGNIRATSLSVGASPLVSGATMTGTGGVINTDGTFALGNAATNLSFDGSVLHINGEVIATGNIQFDLQSVYRGTSASGSLASTTTTVLASITHTPTFTGQITITLSGYVAVESLVGAQSFTYDITANSTTPSNAKVVLKTPNVVLTQGPASLIRAFSVTAGTSYTFRFLGLVSDSANARADYEIIMSMNGVKK